MDQEDARFQALLQLHERRMPVVCWLEKGIKVMQIVTMTGLGFGAVRAAIDCFDSVVVEANPWGQWQAYR